MCNIRLLLGASILLLSGQVKGAVIEGAIVTLDNFIQEGRIFNGGEDSNITSIIYDLGEATVGAATWDLGGSPGPNIGTPSDFLSNNRFAQTLTFSDLSIVPGEIYDIGWIDIDYIVSLSPLSVSGGIPDDRGATSLTNAQFTIFWDTGYSESISLLQQPWNEIQFLELGTNVLEIPPEEPSPAPDPNPPTPVPTPPALVLFLTGIVGLGAARVRIRNK